MSLFTLYIIHPQVVPNLYTEKKNKKKTMEVNGHCHLFDYILIFNLL